MKAFYLLICFLHISIIGRSQKIVHEIFASTITAAVYSTDNSDPLNAISNIAFNARVKDPYVGFSYQNKFLINEINLTNGIIVIPSSFGGFSFAATSYGLSNYRQSKLSLGYGRNVGKSVELGIGFHLQQFSVPQYLNASTFTSELGLVAHLNEKIAFGADIFNPFTTTIKNFPNTKLAGRYRTGVGYQFSEEILLNAELIKEDGYSLEYLFAIKYSYLNKFHFSSSYSFTESKFVASAGLNLNYITLNIIIEQHPVLGLSPGVTCILKLNKWSKAEQ